MRTRHAVELRLVVIYTQCFLDDAVAAVYAVNAPEAVDEICQHEDRGDSDDDTFDVAFHERPPVGANIGARRLGGWAVRSY